MIGNVVIENFKSITKLELELGRVNVLIGANGCGKSNILEAIALASAAAADKLDNEFLASRGIRVPDDLRLMLPAFNRAPDFDSERIKIQISPGIGRSAAGVSVFECHVYPNETPIDGLLKATPINHVTKLDFEDYFRFKGLPVDTTVTLEMVYALADDPEWNTWLSERKKTPQINSFLVYSPENHRLRRFDEEGQIQPIGIHGEGLFKLLTRLASDGHPEEFVTIKEQLRLIDWFEDFDFSPTFAFGDRSLRIKDKYFDPALPEMSQRSSNEGFLFLLFYFCLFISDLTPKFFAVDNVDASLNPKLCARLMVQLTELAKKHDKQAIFTTHNPAVLDGIDLDDDEQRIFVVYRNRNGHTTVKRVQKPQPIDGVEPVRLSEAFMRGYIGGLPNNF